MANIDIASFKRFGTLPPELREKIWEASLNGPRFLDIRVKSQFAPLAVAHACREARYTAIRFLQLQSPGVTNSHLYPLSGLLFQRNLNPRWISRSDLVLVDTDRWQAGQVMLEPRNNVARIGLLVRPTSQPNWASSLGGILQSCQPVIFLVFELGDQAWSMQDVDDFVWLSDADFAGEYTGLAYGVEGHARIGRLVMNGDDVTQQLAVWI